MPFNNVAIVFGGRPRPRLPAVRTTGNNIFTIRHTRPLSDRQSCLLESAAL